MLPDDTTQEHVAIPAQAAPGARHGRVPVAGSAVPNRAQPLQGRRSGVVSRLLADGVDVAVVSGVLALGYVGLCVARFLWRSWAFTFPTPSFLLMLLLGALVSVLYLTTTWATTGRSYGKHVLGLRVVGPVGRMRLGAALARSVLCVVFPIGILWVALSPQNRSVQDVVLRTSVVYDWLRSDEPLTARPPQR